MLLSCSLPILWKNPGRWAHVSKQEVLCLSLQKLFTSTSFSCACKLNSILPKQFYEWKQLARYFKKLQRKICIYCIAQVRLYCGWKTALSQFGFSGKQTLGEGLVFRGPIRVLGWAVKGRGKEQDWAGEKSGWLSSLSQSQGNSRVEMLIRVFL